MYVEIDGQLEPIKQIEMQSNSKTFLFHIETDTGVEGLYKWLSESPNHFRLRKFISSDIPSDIVCGNNDFLIQMAITLFNIHNQHQIIVSLIFKNITKDFRVTTKSSNDEQKSTFICSPEYSFFSILEVLLKKPRPGVIRTQNGKF